MKDGERYYKVKILLCVMTFLMFPAQALAQGRMVHGDGLGLCNGSDVTWLAWIMI